MVIVAEDATQQKIYKCIIGAILHLALKQRMTSQHCARNAMRPLRTLSADNDIKKRVASMQQAYKARIVGVSPLLMHNGQMANPLNPFAKEIKRISSKRHKTDADLEEMAKIEWHAGLYLLHGKPCIPGLVLDATLINAAKKVKKGMQAKAGLFSPSDFLLKYDGPGTVQELWEDERFRFAANVRVQRNTIVRMRPKFDTWEADIELCYNDEQLNVADMQEFLVTAGRDIGLMDYRPRFGRFVVQ